MSRLQQSIAAGALIWLVAAGVSGLQPYSFAWPQLMVLAGAGIFVPAGLHVCRNHPAWRGVDWPQVDQLARELLVAQRVKPESFTSQPPVVHFALQSMAMRQLGITPVGLAGPFSRLDSPYLARSVGQHIRVVRFHAENMHGVQLTELDPPTGTP